MQFLLLFFVASLSIFVSCNNDFTLRWTLSCTTKSELIEEASLVSKKNGSNKEVVKGWYYFLVSSLVHCM